LSQPTPAQRKAAYWLCGAGVALIWPLGTLTGRGTVFKGRDHQRQQDCREDRVKPDGFRRRQQFAL
jgi:hypothetical protein